MRDIADREDFVMKIIDGGITAAQGFCAAGIAAGIKKGNSKDMAMIYSEQPCRAAGTFTKNIVKEKGISEDVVFEGIL